MLAKQKATLGESYNNRKIDRLTYSMCSLTNPGCPGANEGMCELRCWYSGGGGGEHVCIREQRAQQREREEQGHRVRRGEIEKRKSER